ncbi:MAG: NAD-dependent epimerase/dehydratase family protein [Polyangiales bacterium]
MNNALVLITGVSGFIAKHCAVELLNAGYRVRGTIRSLGRALGPDRLDGRRAVWSSS